MICSMDIDHISEEIIRKLPETTIALIDKNTIKSIVEASFSTVEATGTPPQCFGICGGVAAGKTSLRKLLLAEGALPTTAFIHDPDDVMMQIPEYKRMVAHAQSQEAQKKFDPPALEIAEALLDYAIKLKVPILYERTFANQEKTLERLQDIKDSGYQNRALYGVFTSPSLIKVRLKNREIETGRYFPDDEALDRTKKIAQNWDSCSNMFDRSYLYANYNSGEKPKLVYAKSQNKEDKPDEAAYRFFLNMKK
jgi:predicted ABC-type ATPase